MDVELTGGVAGLGRGAGQRLEPLRGERGVDHADAFVPRRQARAQVAVQEPVPVVVAAVEGADMTAWQQTDLVDAARHGLGHSPHHLGPRYPDSTSIPAADREGATRP